MDLLQIFLWLIYPYVVVAIVGMGWIWRVDTQTNDDEKVSFKKRSLFLNRTIISLMFLSFSTGVGVILFNSITNEPEKLFHWVKSLVYLEPDLDLIRSTSFLSRTHFILLLTFLLLLSFSTYIGYVTKPFLYVKEIWEKKIYQSNS
jgi:nitrate reductase gamma subunit